MDGPAPRLSRLNNPTTITKTGQVWPKLYVVKWSKVNNTPSVIRVMGPRIARTRWASTAMAETLAVPIAREPVVKQIHAQSD